MTDFRSVVVLLNQGLHQDRCVGDLTTGKSSAFDGVTDILERLLLVKAALCG